MDTIENKIRNILIELVSEDDRKVIIAREKEIPDFVEDLDFDSLMIISFIAMVEEEFGVSFEHENTVDIVWDFEVLKEWLKENAKME